MFIYFNWTNCVLNICMNEVKLFKECTQIHMLHWSFIYCNTKIYFNFQSVFETKPEKSQIFACLFRMFSGDFPKMYVNIKKRSIVYHIHIHVLTRLLGHHVFLHLWRAHELALSPHPEIQFAKKQWRK